MKTFAVAATLLAAAPAALGQAFGGLSVHSGSAIQYGTINAAGGFFWIGRETSSYCPSSVVEDCPPGNMTIFAGGENTLGLDVSVPGGQQVYINPTGALAFTQAHSAFMPNGSIQDGFAKSEGESFGFLSWTNGFEACRPALNASAPFQVFGGGYPHSNGTECIGFDFLTSNYTGEPNAWQYA